MINVITTGCSFTHAPDSWANVLPTKLSNNFLVKNVAQGGVGQDYNTRMAVSTLEKFSGRKLCIAQISGFARFEMIIDQLEQPDLYNTLKPTEEEEHKFLTNFDVYSLNPRGLRPKESWYELEKDTIMLLRTTDRDHNWYKSGHTAKWVENARKVLISTDQQLIWAYERIAFLQMYCQINNIPLLCFLGWRNCMQEPYNTELVNRSKNLVNWDKFWFYDGNGGMAEWMIDQGYHGNLEEDQTNNPPTGIGYDPSINKKIMIGHPTAEAHEAFCKEIIIPWIKENE